MSDVAIDPTKIRRVAFYCPVELRAELETWRASRRPIPSESAAVIELLRQALEQWRKEQVKERKR
jgi:hypothetical protein